MVASKAPSKYSAESVNSTEVAAGEKNVVRDSVEVEKSEQDIVLRQHSYISNFFLGTKVKPVPKERAESPQGKASIFSLSTWSWISPMMKTGFNRILEINDMWTIPEKQRISRRLARYERKLAEYNELEKRPKYKEFRAMAHALRWEFWAYLINVCFHIGAELSLTILSRALIEQVSTIYYHGYGYGRGAGLAVGNSILNIVFMWIMMWMQFRSRIFAELCRTTLILAIYSKMTRLSPRGRQQFPSSKIASLITTDTNRIFMATRWTCLVIMVVPAFFSILGLLVHNIGVAALAGCCLVFVGVVVNVFMSRLITSFRRRSLPFADKRISLVRETIENMRIVKFYGWENSFVEMISKARKKEAGFLKLLGLVEGLTDSILTSAPTFAGVLAFGLRTVLGKALNPAQTFPSLTLFQLFIPYSMMFSAGLTAHADAWASVVRLEEFFKANEDPSYVEQTDLDKTAIVIENGRFKWDVELPTEKEKKKTRRRMRYMRWKIRQTDETIVPPAPAAVGTATGGHDESEKYFVGNGDGDGDGEADLTRAGAKKFPGLLDINLEVAKGELIMVVGPIGSGKSTLLSSILGLSTKTQGTVKVDGVVSSVMSMWSKNDTIRNNILFGSAYDADKYAKVVHVCNLETDFKLFPGGDFSEVGERGITLSGGQKARIALARCVYHGGDIVLLDDVLSAVDGKVSNHIFERCINGYLGDRTRIMSTHNLKLLVKADRVIYMDGDGTMSVGSLDELLDSNPKFRESYMSALNANDDESDAASSLVDDNEIETALDNETNEAVVHKTDKKFELSELDGLQRFESRMKGSPADAKLMQDEQRNRGQVTSDVLYKYLSSGSKLGLPFLAIIAVLSAGVATGTTMQTVWLNFWTSDRYHTSNGLYIGMYAVIITCRMVFFVCLATSVCVFAFNSSSVFHNSAVENLYRAPMSYFDTTPLGRIINRFTDDTANLDTQLYMQIRMTLFSSSMLLASLITIFVYVPYTIIALVPVIGIALIFLSYYRNSAREIKRVNSLFRSRMFTIVMETVSGLSTIVSYKQQGPLRDELCERIDDMNCSFTVNVASQFWMSLRVVMSTACINFLTIMLAVFQVFSLDPSTVGLLLSLLPSVAMSISMLLPLFAELENQMNSVERLYELAYSIPQEAPYHIEETKPAPDWPSKGGVVFDQVSLRYRPNLPVVLNNLSVEIKPGEKVGIVGRTGAGKSTILSALFRITELASGRILIDGTDISTIGLTDLRSKLSIIPQDPVIFEGTIRFNLDPFNERSDVELWDALRRSGVIRENEIKNGKANAEHKFHLDTAISGDGSNFSLGERQLLTLARALVRQSRIIVLDEATATVDIETDKMIQETISKEFAECTILCIAHRLQTIINYDKVIVMDAGQAKEMGSPKKLFRDSMSTFHQMCVDSNITEADFI
ncbi:Oligomycin resistance ATP-dependent permease YOR1 [Wickerhamiella sorbophila]|uniref:Oligomycin resistance ATP-dependent permease YOR1 n=1 Tax=Wickerhamiella sorbophila TaxID=45607 RepID=A0A2T0FFI1_9ASCO|nr:Oligomycin resistance ATP-dependent permease YOR1 [Wickerhamiella sorbophila]PRT53727.1 Oligomycin resistance ATP-dependent permease YOR1 [Wickerhamiella sorbophila]